MDSTQQARRTPTCRYHCAACGSHFASLHAFDAHRQGPADDRVCVEPADVLDSRCNALCRLQTPEGTCTLSYPRGGRERLPRARIWASTHHAQTPEGWNDG